LTIAALALEAIAKTGVDEKSSSIEASKRISLHKERDSSLSNKYGVKKSGCDSGGGCGGQ